MKYYENLLAEVHTNKSRKNVALNCYDIIFIVVNSDSILQIWSNPQVSQKGNFILPFSRQLGHIWACFITNENIYHYFHAYLIYCYFMFNCVLIYQLYLVNYCTVKP